MLGKPCLERTIDLALAYAARRRLAFDPARSVLVHGDAHQWNTLDAPGSATGFKFVDPDGGFAERAFDLAIPMPNGDCLQLGRHQCGLRAALTSVDPVRFQWSVAEADRA